MLSPWREETPLMDLFADPFKALLSELAFPPLPYLFAEIGERGIWKGLIANYLAIFTPRVCPLKTATRQTSLIPHTWASPSLDTISARVLLTKISMLVITAVYYLIVLTIPLPLSWTHSVTGDGCCIPTGYHGWIIRFPSGTYLQGSFWPQWLSTIHYSQSGGSRR